MVMEKCKVAKRCGGCQLQNMEYPEQLAYKQRRAEYLLSPFGKVQPIVGMEKPYHYRNKVQAAFYYDYRTRRCASGVFQSGSRRIVPIDNCLLDDKAADAIIVTVRKLADSFKIRPFDMRYGSGVLRHVLVRRSRTTGEVMVVIVTLSAQFPSKRNFVKALLIAHPEITTVVHNINPYDTDLVLGETSTVLYGSGYIEDELCGCRFRISPSSFYQVNSEMCERLYSKAIDLAGLTGEETLLDAYSGTGTIGIIAAEKAGRVLSVELNRDAVRDAVYNAQANKRENMEFIAADAADYIRELAQKKEALDVVMMDPPRAGASEKFLKALCRIMPKRIVYISCNPQTLARDLKYLTAHGFKVKHMQPFDMFPHTKHMECVTMMTKK